MKEFKSISEVYDYIEREARRRAEEILRREIYGKESS